MKNSLKEQMENHRKYLLNQIAACNQIINYLDKEKYEKFYYHSDEEIREMIKMYCRVTTVCTTCKLRRNCVIEELDEINTGGLYNIINTIFLNNNQESK